MAGESIAEKEGLLREWLQEHQEKLQDLRATLAQMVGRLEGFGHEVEERITSEQYLMLVRKTFREWDEADTAGSFCSSSQMLLVQGLFPTIL
jgi:hypothetical protein